MRTQAGLTQAELAEKINVTPEFISRVERGKCGFSFPLLERLAETLGVKVEDLFRFDKKIEVKPDISQPVLREIMFLLSKRSKQDLLKAQRILKALFKKQ